MISDELKSDNTLWHQWWTGYVFAGNGSEKDKENLHAELQDEDLCKERTKVFNVITLWIEVSD
jgi:hypothetical protein